MTTSAQQLADRYAALWAEPDADQRRKAIERLWAEDGVHLVHPPESIRAEAALVGFPEPVLEARGHRELEIRVARAYQEFLTPKLPGVNAGDTYHASRGTAARGRDGWFLLPPPPGVTRAPPDFRPGGLTAIRRRLPHSVTR
ncbi:hypothetical protein ACIRYZ_04670 [Kitasatospora sp. NPDC101155]|uniref:hypothetical protein n=1 Tax=Kitasatospora sp. NPDC101155 TaxID=3364097 RepID=UPI003806E365